MDKKQLFTPNDIELPCPKNMVWDEMQIVNEKQRACAGCDKVLFDVTGYTLEEVEALQKKHGNICVAVTNTIVASSLALSLSACSTKNNAENENIKPPSEIEKVVVEEKKEPLMIKEDKPKVETIIDENREVIIPPAVVVIPEVVVGLPARQMVPCPFGKRVLNSLKEFFHVGEPEYCYDY